MQSFQASGLCYLPSDPDRLVAGTLEFSKENGLRLRLSGSLGEATGLHKTDQHGAVYGVLESSRLGRFVLATACLRVKYSISMPGYSTEELAPAIAFVSSRPFESEAIDARSVQVRLVGLDEWAQVGRGLELRAEPDQSLVFRYFQPAEHGAHVNGSTCDLRFLATWVLRLRTHMLGGVSSSVSGQDVFWVGERLSMLLKIAIGSQLPSLRPKLRDCFARNPRFVHLIQKTGSGS